MSADPSSHPGPEKAHEDPPSVVDPVTEPEMAGSAPGPVEPLPDARDATNEQGQAPSIPDADDSQRPSSSTTSALTSPMSGFSVGLSVRLSGSSPIPTGPIRQAARLSLSNRSIPTAATPTHPSVIWTGRALSPPYRVTPWP